MSGLLLKAELVAAYYLEVESTEMNKLELKQPTEAHHNVWILVSIEIPKYRIQMHVWMRPHRLQVTEITTDKYSLELPIHSNLVHFTSLQIIIHEFEKSTNRKYHIEVKYIIRKKDITEVWSTWQLQQIILICKSKNKGKTNKT